MTSFHHGAATTTTVFNRALPETSHSRSDYAEQAFERLERYYREHMNDEHWQFLQGLDEIVESTLSLLDRAPDAEDFTAGEYEIKNMGASDLAIEKLERLEKFDGEDCCCTICLEEMGCGEGRVIWLECEHVFDESCLVSWLRISNSCPLCRFQVSD